MKKVLTASIGFLCLMTTIGCVYHPGTYDPCSGCSVGSGWQIGCSTGSCSTGCDDGCTSSSCSTYHTPVYEPVPLPSCSQPVAPSCGQPICDTGCDQSCQSECNSCYGGHASSCLSECPLNPLNWIRHIFHAKRRSNCYSSNSCGYESPTDCFNAPACGCSAPMISDGCQSGSCGTNMYPAAAPAPAATPAVVPQRAKPITPPSPVTSNIVFPKQQTGITSQPTSSTRTTLKNVSYWVPTKRR